LLGVGAGAGGGGWMQMDAVARKIKWQKFYFILYLC
jgi:hypothetical protein